MKGVIEMDIKNGLSHVRTFAFGVVVGGLVGAVTALMIAPHSGKEVQAEVKAKALALKEEAEQIVAKWRHSLESTATKARNKAAETLKQTSLTLHQTARKLKSPNGHDQTTASETAATDEQDETIVDPAQ